MSYGYYEERDAKVAIAIELVKRGWKIYGFHEDQSDSMTDYWCPASWDGVATKDGYIAVFGVSEYSRRYLSGKEVKDYNYNNDNFVVSAKTKSLIERLSEVRQDRGASAAEEATAKKKIEALKAKVEKADKYIVVDRIPEFQANPPRMSWHVEKDGTIIAKGNGIGKFSNMKRYDENYYKEILEAYKNNKESYRYKEAQEAIKTAKLFEKLLNKVDSAAGCLIGGSGKGYVYENIEVTEYKKENKAVQNAGSLKDGQCFVVSGNGFNHGITKGSVYRIHEHIGANGDKFYTAIKLNKRLDKELSGNTLANTWGIITGKYLEKFLGWFDKGVLAYCTIECIKTPYKVQKCVKKAI